MHALTAENSDSLDGKCSLTERARHNLNACVPRATISVRFQTWAEQAQHPLPTWHCTFCSLKTNATCFSSSCVYHSQHVNMPQLLQPLATLVVSRESCLHLGMSDLRCTSCSFSVSCRARYVSVQCRLVVLAAFASCSFKMIVTKVNPHRVLYCIP